MQTLKYSVVFIFILLSVACANVKKVQVIKDALSVKASPDSAALAEKARLDSLIMIKGIVQHIAQTKIIFNTMNARLKLDYETPKNKDSYIANLSIQKDSGMYITIRGAMGVIGLKAYINKDSVVLIYPLSKKTEKHPLFYLQEVVKIPLTYQTIEDLIVGNPIFMDSVNIISYKVIDERLQISLLGKIFKNLIVLSEDNTKLVQLKLDDVDATKHRTSAITYSEHRLFGQFQFPMNRSISINAQSKLDLSMEIKEFNFDEPLKYSFSIPKDGRRK